MIRWFRHEKDDEKDENEDWYGCVLVTQDFVVSTRFKRRVHPKIFFQSEELKKLS